MPMEFIVPSLRVTTITNITEIDTMQTRLDKLMELEEDRFIVGLHRRVLKAQHKTSNNRHIGNKHFQPRMLLLYDSKVLKHLGKFQMHLLGPYRIEYITDAREVKLSNLNGEER